MMKKVFMVIFIYLSVTGLSFAGDDPAQKRIEKRIKKIWNAESVIFKEASNSPGSDPKGVLYYLINVENKLGFLYRGRVYTCGANGCEKPADNQEREYFDFFLITDLDGKILHIEITEYAATHGYEVSSPGWLKQFRGRDTPGTYGKDIDAISGATKSGTGMVEEINILLEKISALTKSPETNNIAGQNK